MIKVLIIEQDALGGVTWWRFFRPFMQMRKMFPGQIDFEFKTKLFPSDLYLNDVFIMSRPRDKEMLQVIQRIKELGKPVILDIDDDIINLPAHHPMKGDYDAWREISLEYFRLADWIWTSTKQLLFTTDALNRGEVIPNAILPSELPDKPAPDKGIWCWRGQHHQIHDLLYGSMQYEEIKHHAQKWIFWGWWPPLDHPANAVLRPFERDTHQYFKALPESAINVMWKPLTPGLFNDAKSNIAWIEATMSGGVCLTNYAGKPGWECALSGPVDYKTACIFFQESCEEIRRNYNLENTARQRMDSIKRLLGHSDKPTISIPEGVNLYA